MCFDDGEENFASTRKIASVRFHFSAWAAREPTTNSRFHNFGFQELSSELSFRHKQSTT